MSVEDKMQPAKNSDSEQRIAELETQLAFQEDHLQKLNDALVDQQKRIDAMEVSIKQYEKRLGEIQGSGEGEASAADEIPPHY